MEHKYVQMDLLKIFFTPPNTTKERIGFCVLLIMVFVACFAPICFTQIHPVRAILISAMPALSLSWGWLVFTRSLFRRKEFSTPKS